MFIPRPVSVSSPTTSTSPRVHFQVWVPPQNIDGQERRAMAKGEPFLGSAIFPGAPARPDQRFELLARSSGAQRPAKIGASRRVEAQVPQAVRSQPASIARRTEG